MTTPIPALARNMSTASWWPARWPVSSSTSPYGTTGNWPRVRPCTKIGAFGPGGRPTYGPRPAGTVRTGTGGATSADPGARAGDVSCLAVASASTRAPGTKGLVHASDTTANRLHPGRSSFSDRGPPGHASRPWLSWSVKVVPPLERSTSSMPPPAARTVQRSNSSAVVREWTCLRQRWTPWPRRRLCPPRLRPCPQPLPASACAAASLANYAIGGRLWRLGERSPVPRLWHAWTGRRAAWHAPQLPGRHCSWTRLRRPSAQRQRSRTATLAPRWPRTAAGPGPATEDSTSPASCEGGRDARRRLTPQRQSPSPGQRPGPRLGGGTRASGDGWTRSVPAWARGRDTGFRDPGTHPRSASLDATGTTCGFTQHVMRLMEWTTRGTTGTRPSAGLSPQAVSRRSEGGL